MQLGTFLQAKVSFTRNYVLCKGEFPDSQDLGVECIIG
jgi:hypothetical protein